MRTTLIIHQNIHMHIITSITKSHDTNHRKELIEQQKKHIKRITTMGF